MLYQALQLCWVYVSLLLLHPVDLFSNPDAL